MMSHTFCFSVATPALEIGLSASPADRVIEPCVALEAEERLSIATPALDIRLSTPPTDWGIEPHVALEAEERTFINSPDTAEESAEESAKESEPNPTQPAQDPATSQKKGSFFSDWKGIYKMEWPNVAEFDVWRREVEIANSIEFRRSTVKQGRTGLWICSRLFVCGRRETGGSGDKYQKLNPDRKVIESKKIKCPCRFIIKQYPHTKIILGRYLNLTHNHPLGKENIRHTNISHDTRECVKTLLEQKVDCWEIVSNNNYLD